MTTALENRYKAAVIGLGNIGYLFSRDSKRAGTWSHSHAYHGCGRTILAAGVDPDPIKRKLFAEEFPNAQLFGSIDELFSAFVPDIVSICTPTAMHYPIFKELLSQPVRGIICEKPFAENLDQARQMVHLARQRDVVVAVNHLRRWNDNYRLAADIVKQGGIGRLTALHAFYPGQLYNIGTHVFDTLLMMAARRPLSATGIQVESFDPKDPSVTGMLTLEDGLTCTFAATGRRLNLVFEIDVVGDEGRIRVIHNGNSIELYKFGDSPNYSGYRELIPEPLAAPGPGDLLLNTVRDMTQVLDGLSEKTACSAEDGYWTMAVIDALLDSMRAGGAPCPVIGLDSQNNKTNHRTDANE